MPTFEEAAEQCEKCYRPKWSCLCAKDGGDCCARCRSFVAEEWGKASTKEGECRRMSPRHLDQYGNGIWPKVPNTAWCDEFDDRSEK
jgi:hypothetical protein